ncbi:MAG TPA: ELWxxDGT repeat protein [Candidatus Polarisedimenticolaceae bacterium]|nr:ELWxxDGT repeat protein [Candidatus Polarisedimenticolaceae bacterium]
MAKTGWIFPLTGGVIPDSLNTLAVRRPWTALGRWPACGIVSVLCLGIVTARPAFAEQYVISGSPDGTGSFVVDDALDVDLNGVQFYSDGDAPSGERIPFQLPLTAEPGDTLRFRVRDTFGNCASLAPLFITNASGCSAVIDPGFTRPCSPEPGTPVAHDYTTTIPELCLAYSAERVADIRPGPGSSAPTAMAVFNDALYFAANDGTLGRELWRLPRGAAAPELVTDIALGTAGSSPTSLTVAGNTLYFIATTTAAGTELFQYDGVSPAGLAADVRPGSQASLFSPGLTAYGDRVFFKAWDGVSGGEDLFAFGPNGLTAFNLDPDGSNPYGFVVHNGVLYFGAATAATGAELFSYDGVAVTEVVDLVPGGSSNPGGMTGLGNLLIFNASNPFGQRNLHVLDLGTGLDTEINKSVAFAFQPSGFVRMNDRVYFTADDGLNGRELWITDGTDAGTRLVADIYPGPTGSTFRNLIPFGGELLFGASDASTGFELRATNGYGARLVADVAPGSANSAFEGPIAVPNALFFVSPGDGPWLNPWVTNGTSTGTQVIRKSDGSPINPTGDAMDDTRFTLFDGALYFAGNDGVSGFELWRIRLGAAPPCSAPDEEVHISLVTLDVDGKPVLHYTDPNPQSEVTGYNIYRASDPQGPWTMIGSNVVDMDPGTADTQYVDGTGDVGSPWFYEIAPFNSVCSAEGPW